ncbi:MAG: hypothetical protein KVP17_003559 [Porospora cf. gigantea B]|uniref:uncharacterized protein n=1 Tax=Porospora cf. gigantea B TaxID=2853592 RepID=UPI00357188AD|nr:MAG: hypothetical protein KVP17_003559 [Porospora cf. gigantea B]
MRRSRSRETPRDRRRARSPSPSLSSRAKESETAVAAPRPDMSPERARSRERERRRRKLQTECIRRAGGFQRLADSEGREPVRLVWDGFQWVAKTGVITAANSDPSLMNSTRKLRRLYFGGLPIHVGLKETQLQDVIFEEMKKRKLCANVNQNPVLCVWFARENANYGFVELATIEETDKALALDGMDVLGYNVSVSRPNDYSNVTLPGSGAQMTINPVQAEAAIGAVELDRAGTRFIRFVAICTKAELEESGDTWNEVLHDICDGCGQFGKIRRSIIMSPLVLSNAPAALNATDGDVFLEYETPACADLCLTKMLGRKYNGKAVQGSKVQPEQFELLETLFALAGYT